jgi:hypothetical protein
MNGTVVTSVVDRDNRGSSCTRVDRSTGGDADRGEDSTSLSTVVLDTTSGLGHGGRGRGNTESIRGGLDTAVLLLVAIVAGLLLSVLVAVVLVVVLAVVTGRHQ